jgi:hypothetical protein
VADGWVRLTGKVDWNYQRTAAADAVQRLAGVKGVTNLVAVRPRLTVPDVKARIEAALRRNAEVEAHGIEVQARDGTVTLRGHVQSWAEPRRCRVRGLVGAGRHHSGQRAGNRILSRPTLDLGPEKAMQHMQLDNATSTDAMRATAVARYTYHLFSSRTEDDVVILLYNGQADVIGQVFFVTDDLPLPPAVDMLRNEGPIELRWAGPFDTCLSTEFEPVGEGEASARRPRRAIP